jgi:CheY-like chemotaxis protein
MFTPAMRHDYPHPAADGFTGYLVKPLRAASLAARMAASAPTLTPDVAIAELPDQDITDTSAPRPARGAKGLSILLAEDNEINALLMRTLLTRLGHETVLTTNGEAALESWIAAEAAGTPYDLVLMDVQMPRLDGIEATRQIRAREAGQRVQRTPILALTANALVEDRYACFEAGMDGFLVKPLDRDKLTEALAGLMLSRHLAA